VFYALEPPLMKNLTEDQKTELINYMKRNEGSTFKEHSAWATKRFGVYVSDVECHNLFMDSMFA